MRALAIAATGMSAQQTNVEVIANNIANINTTAFKRARAEFSDLIYQTDRAEGVPNRGGEDVVPEGAQIGLGVRTVGRAQSPHPGAAGADRRIRSTWPSTGAAGSRSPAPAARRSTPAPAPSTRTATGQLVTGDGYARQSGDHDPGRHDRGHHQRIGRGLRAARRARRRRSCSASCRWSTSPTTPACSRSATTSIARPPHPGRRSSGVAGDPGFGSIHQGYLEESNVDPVREITELISAQRAYEMNSKVIQAADDMQKQVSQGIR